VRAGDQAASTAQLDAQRSPHVHRDHRALQRPAGHRVDLAVEELVLHVARGLVLEVGGVGVAVEASGRTEAHDPTRIPFSPPRAKSGGGGRGARCKVAASMRAVVLACFFLSGASGLILEMLWTRMLTLVFGSTTLAVSTVLTAFM